MIERLPITLNWGCMERDPTWNLIDCKIFLANHFLLLSINWRIWHEIKRHLKKLFPCTPLIWDHLWILCQFSLASKRTCTNPISYYIFGVVVVFPFLLQCISLKMLTLKSNAISTTQQSFSSWKVKILYVFKYVQLIIKMLIRYWLKL